MRIRARLAREIGYFLDCLGLFDLHEHYKNEEWATRVHVAPGDLLAMPAGTFYLLVLDEGMKTEAVQLYKVRVYYSVPFLRVSNSDLASDLFCFSRHLRRTLDAFSFSLTPFCLFPSTEC